MISNNARVASLIVIVLLASVVAGCGSVAAHEDHGSESGHGGEGEAVCPNANTEWQAERTIANVSIQQSRVCRPDNPNVVAAVTAGTNNVPKDVLMKSGLGPDAVRKHTDRDDDGDPDVIEMTVEVMGLNEYGESIPYEIAPGVRPAFWTFAPQGRGMVDTGSSAASLIEVPSPSMRAEQGDTVRITVSNTHYFPHTIHFHGVDHEYEVNGSGNDGVPQTSEKPILPGESRTYEFTPRQAGTMFYHCHVLPNIHVAMGLQGMFTIAEDRPNNTVQSFNLGAGKVRHPSAGISENYTAEYDLVYQGVDKELHQIPQQFNDPRMLAKQMNRRYDTTETTPDYFLMNGKSFPLTVRESLIVVEPNERYRLRVLNGGSETISLHTHGHKVDIEAYDGVEVPDGQEITRDVVSLTAAQRVDLTLNTTENGLQSYGQGVWFVHDHREQAVTTDGIAPGGTPSMIVYESYLSDRGVPETNTNLSRYFDEEFYEGNVPVWGHLDPTHLGAPPNRTLNDTGNTTNANTSGTNVDSHDPPTKSGHHSTVSTYTPDSAIRSAAIAVSGAAAMGWAL